MKRNLELDQKRVREGETESNEFVVTPVKQFKCSQST